MRNQFKIFICIIIPLVWTSCRDNTLNEEQFLFNQLRNSQNTSYQLYKSQVHNLVYFFLDQLEDPVHRLNDSELLNYSFKVHQTSLEFCKQIELYENKLKLELRENQKNADVVRLLTHQKTGQAMSYLD